MKYKSSPYKRCPRCDNKCLATHTKCDECGLVFARMDMATNKAAKNMIKRGDRQYVLYTKNLPKDISYVKLLLFSIFLGLVGGHYYYTGKYIKAFLMSAGFAYTLVCVIFNYALQNFMDTYYLYVPIGILAFSWVVSVCYVLIKKFKVPVCIETTKTGGLKV